MRGGQQQESDKSLDLFWVVALVGCILLGLWYFNHANIVKGIFIFRIYQGYALLACVDYMHEFIAYWGFPQPNTDAFQYAMSYMASSDTSSVSLTNLLSVSIAYGSLFKYVCAALSLMAGIYMMQFNLLSKYRSTYTMALFSRDESVNWPIITPILDKNLVKDSIATGPWAMSMRPLDFCKKHNLIYPGTTSDGKMIAHLYRGPAVEIFALQLGPLWEGLEKLPPYILALFTCFAAKGSGDDKGCKKLLRQIARSTETGHLDFGGTRELLVKHVQNPKIGRAIGPHAYLYTVMASMLEYSRNDGVLASSEFLWLRPLDRQLWYTLNCVGRQTPFCEVAGVMAHFKIEQRLRRPLKVPMVDEAVNALEAALGEIIYNPDGN